jgi:hypothetical protein
MHDPITDPTQATPQWLTETLRANGSLAQGEVEEVSCSKHDKTFTATIAFLQVRYSANASPTAPERLFLKMSGDATAPGSFDLDHFRQEVLYYSTVAAAMPDPPSVPCHDVAHSEDFSQCHLLLDDITETHSQPEHPLPPTDEQCEQAIVRLARFQAFWWENPRLGVDIGHIRTPEERVSGIPDARERTRGFIDFLGDRLSTARRQTYEAVLEALPRLSERRFESGNITLVHGDAHLWNFMFPNDPAAHPVHMIDWQFWNPTIGTTDLAFMIAREWYPERRRRLEERLIRRYHTTLLECGVDRYGWDECWLDYRLAVIQVSLFIPVWQWSIFNAGPRTWWSGLERAMLAFEDLHCAEMLEV